MNGIQQLKVVEPNLSDPHVPDQPEWITKTTADPPEVDGVGFLWVFFCRFFFCVFPSFRVFGNHWKILISIDEAIVIQMLPILIILILSLSGRDDLISTWIPGGVVVHGRKLVPRFWGFRISQSISRSRQTLESLRSANTGSSEKKRYCVLDASCSDVWGYGTQLFEEFSQCESQFCIVKSRGKSSSVYMKRSMRRLWICHCDSDPHFASCNRKRVGWCTFGRRRSQNKVKAIHHWNWNWKDISEYASLLDGRKASMQIEMSKQKVIRIFILGKCPFCLEGREFENWNSFVALWWPSTFLKWQRQRPADLTRELFFPAWIKPVANRVLTDKIKSRLL